MADALILEFKAKTDDLDKRLKSIEKSVSDTGKASQKVTADMGAQFKNLGGQIAAAFGIAAGISVFVGAIRGAFNAAKDFEAQMSKVRAISGATDAEMKKLNASAKALGASTMFTASQVGQLQEEYARLGFNTKEILAATEATLNLAAATGSTLGEAAEVAGSTLRAFDLDASETTRVADVMGASFAASSLNMERFRESMKMVAPVARTAGISLEMTTAMLAQLSKVGINGSLAGTGLKNIIFALSDANSKLAQDVGFAVKNNEDLIRAFQVMREKGIDLTEALELTDKRAVTAFVTLKDGIEDVSNLSDNFDKANGTIKAMADIMQDNLQGSITRLSSAWEGLTNEIAGSQGAIKFVVDLLTKSVSGWTMIMERLGGVTAEQVDLIKRGMEIVKLSTSQATTEIEKIIKPLEEAGDAAGAAAKAQELQSAVLDRLSSKLKNQSIIIDGIKKAEEELKEIVESSYGFDKLRISAKQEEIEQLKLRKIAADTDVESIEAQIGVYERYIEKLNAAGGGGGAIESNVRSIALLNTQLKDLKDQLTKAEIGSNGFWKVLFKIEAKLKELRDAEAMTKLIEDLTPDADDTSAQDAKISAEVQAEIDKYNRLKKERDDFNKYLSEKNSEDISAELEKINEIEAAEKAARERKKEEDALAREENIANAQMFLNSVLEINNAITSAIMAGHEQEQISLDNQLEAGQISREQYDQRRRQLEREKAQDAKTAAIFNAVIGTALAVVNAIAVGPPQGYILAAISAALGAVEIGVIASQPLPQFAKGVIGLKGEGTETSDSIHARLSKGESVMTARETRQHRPILEAIRKGTLEKLIAETYVRPAVDAAMFSGLSDMGRSADLNGLTAKLSDHNIIAAMDRNRSATVYGLKMLADKLDKRTPKRGGYA